MFNCILIAIVAGTTQPVMVETYSKRYVIRVSGSSTKIYRCGWINKDPRGNRYVVKP